MKWRSLEETASHNELRPLRDIYAERRRLIERYVPAESRAIHARAVAELRANRIADKIPAVGSTAPAFELQNHNGKRFSSAEALANGPLIVFFLRGRWCPFCVGQVEAMNQLFPALRQASASLAGISPQTVQQSYFMHGQHKLQFPLLSDAGNRVAHQFGLVYRVADYQRELYKRVFVNLPHANGDESWELPIPATFVIGKDGKLRFATASEDYMERPEPLEILDLVQRLSQG